MAELFAVLILGVLVFFAIKYFKRFFTRLDAEDSERLNYLRSISLSLENLSSSIDDLWRNELVKQMSKTGVSPENKED